MQQLPQDLELSDIRVPAKTIVFLAVRGSLRLVLEDGQSSCKAIASFGFAVSQDEFR